MISNKISQKLLKEKHYYCRWCGKEITEKQEKDNSGCCNKEHQEAEFQADCVFSYNI